jgi:DNA (cytosine-5)-methyltransferase 1
VIGSLCSGYGGLDLAVDAVFGQPVAWHCEIEAAPSRVLEAHWPGVPNLRDLTEVDWGSVEPVDIVTAGYPCQPFSHAGKRKGTDDERHLWPYVAAAIRGIRPRIVVLENVAGHRSLGFDTVQADLAALRYDVRWASVRAADVGAPHGRERVFIVAADAGSETVGLGAGLRAGRAAGLRRGRPHHDALTSAADTDQPGLERRHSRGNGADERATGPAGMGTAANAVRIGRGCWTASQPGRRQERRTAAAGGGAQPVEWGRYEPAIRRWERILRRDAPPPTEPGPRGGRRLSPRFVEWMMGLPDGWVTDADGISRNEALRMLGNGVVPQQAEAALRALTAAAAVA